MKVISYGVADPQKIYEWLMSNIPAEQALREFVTNGIEGIQRYRDEVDPNYSGRILIGLDREYYAAHKVTKLCFIDTGCGMTKDQLITYFSDLVASGNTGDLHGRPNKGLGSKLAAGRISADGVMIQSWIEGDLIGNQCTLGSDNEGRFGLAATNDGLPEILPCPDSMPKEIKVAGHGTKVTILGHDIERPTFSPEIFDGISKNKQFFVTHILNERFFVIPDYVNITTEGILSRKIRTSGPASNKGMADFYTKRIGMKPTETIQRTYGSVQLEDGVVAKWVLIDQGLMSTQQKDTYVMHYNPRVAIVWKGEVYYTTNKKETSKHSLLGLSLSKNKVSVFFDFTNCSHVDTVPERTGLTFNHGQKFGDWVYEKYGAQFAKNIPQEIKQLEKELMNDSDDECDEEFLDQLLKNDSTGLDLSLAPCPESESIGKFDLQSNGKHKLSAPVAERDYPKLPTTNKKTRKRGGKVIETQIKKTDTGSEIPAKPLSQSPNKVLIRVCKKEALSPGMTIQFHPATEAAPPIIMINGEDPELVNAVAKELLPKAKKHFPSVNENILMGKLINLTGRNLAHNAIQAIKTAISREKRNKPDLVVNGSNIERFLLKSRPSFWEDMADSVFSSSRYVSEILSGHNRDAFISKISSKLHGA